MQRDSITNGRRPRNPTQAAFFDLAVEAGWLVATNGWPEFLLQQEDRIICVQTIPPGRQKFRQKDAVLQGILSDLGVPCFGWSADLGLIAGGEGGKGGGVEIVERDTTARALDENAVSLEEKSSRRRGSQGERAAAPAAPQEALEAAPTSPSRSETSRRIDRVWTAYVAAMKPRTTAAGEGERLIIRAALKVATPEELILCIETCAASDYHMKRGQYAGRRGGKYNALGTILKPRPRFEETQRSRIDWWLDRAEENSSGVAGFPSADAAIVGQRQVEVQRGHRSDDPETVKKAKDAEAWLATHGIETVRREADGYPTFRRLGSDE